MWSCIIDTDRNISPGEGNGNPLQFSCLENPMDRGAWWAITIDYSCKELVMTEPLSTAQHIYIFVYGYINIISTEMINYRDYLSVNKLFSGRTQ